MLKHKETEAEKKDREKETEKWKRRKTNLTGRRPTSQWRRVGERTLGLATRAKYFPRLSRPPGSAYKALFASIRRWDGRCFMWPYGDRLTHRCPRRLIIWPAQFRPRFFDCFFASLAGTITASRPGLRSLLARADEFASSRACELGF